MAKTPLPGPVPVPSPNPAPVVGPKGVVVNLPAEGTFTPPPPHAPQETSKPLEPGLIADMQAKAHENEKELAPLKFAIQKAVASAAAAENAGILPPGVVTAPPHAAPDAPAGSEGLSPQQLQNLKDGVSPSALPILPPDATPEEIADPIVNARPARGQPKVILDQGKTITGGWGPEAGGFAPQYYALDGTEVQAIVKRLFAELETLMTQDLRFGIAAVYPQALIRVTIDIAGCEPGAAINDVAFSTHSRIVAYQLAKMDDQETPADALRVEADLSLPHKHTVRTPTGTHIVDRET